VKNDLGFRARAEEEYARSIERLNKNVDFSAEIGFVNLSAFAVYNKCCVIVMSFTLCGFWIPSVPLLLCNV